MKLSTTNRLCMQPVVFIILQSLHKSWSQESSNNNLVFWRFFSKAISPQQVITESASFSHLRIWLIFFFYRQQKFYSKSQNFCAFEFLSHKKKRKKNIGKERKKNRCLRDFLHFTPIKNDFRWNCRCEVSKRTFGNKYQKVTDQIKKKKSLKKLGRQKRNELYFCLEENAIAI